MTNTLETKTIFNKSTYVLGVDPNRKGKDETGIVILEKPFSETSDQYKLYVVHLEFLNTQDMTVLRDRILYLHSLFNFKKILIDDTALNSLTDMLNERLGKELVEGVVFTVKSKPEMFANLKILMQQGRLRIPSYLENPDERCKKLFFQFLSIEQTFKGDSERPLISHESNTHDDGICSLALAAWYFRAGQFIKHAYRLAFSNRRD